MQLDFLADGILRKASCTSLGFRQFVLPDSLTSRRGLLDVCEWLRPVLLTYLGSTWAAAAPAGRRRCSTPQSAHAFVMQTYLSVDGQDVGVAKVLHDLRATATFPGFVKSGGGCTPCAVALPPGRPVCVAISCRLCARHPACLPACKAPGIEGKCLCRIWPADNQCIAYGGFVFAKPQESAAKQAYSLRQAKEGTVQARASAAALLLQMLARPLLLPPLLLWACVQAGRQAHSIAASCVGVQSSWLLRCTCCPADISVRVYWP